MKPREILHILGTAQPEGTSLARIVQTLAAHLDPDLYRLTVWFLGPHGPLVDTFISQGIEARAFKWPKGALPFAAAMATRHFDLVHQHHGARAIRAQISAPLIVHVHGDATNPEIATIGADAVIAVSHYVARQLTREATVIYPGLPTHPGTQNPEQPPIIGMATRLVEGKGLEILPHLDLPAPLEIAGAGPLRPDAPNVKYLGWQTDLTPHFHRWSIFLMPATNEGFGLAALEAMAHGLPVVAFNSGALPELVLHNETGLLSTPETLSADLRTLIGNPALRAGLGHAAQTRVRTHFSPERMAAQTAELYETLLSDRRIL